MFDHLLGCSVSCFRQTLFCACHIAMNALYMSPTQAFGFIESVQPVDFPEHLEPCRPRFKWQHVPSWWFFNTHSKNLQKSNFIISQGTCVSRKGILETAQVNNFLLSAQVNSKTCCLIEKLQLPALPKNSCHNLHVWFHHFRTL